MTRGYLLNNKNIISFRSGGLTVDEQETLVSQQNNIFGSICNCPDARTKGTFAYQKGLVDSEIACINFLEINAEDIIKKIEASIPTTSVISQISLHGFTTRDMCPACYHHINLYCQNELLKRLLKDDDFRTKLRLSSEFSVNFFISSLYYYPNENFLTNYKISDVDNKGLNCIILRKNKETGQEEQEDIYTNKLSLKEINETKGKSEDREKKKKELFQQGLTMFEKSELWEQNFNSGFYTCLTQPNFLDQINQTIPTIKQSNAIVVNISEYL